MASLDFGIHSGAKVAANSKFLRDLAGALAKIANSPSVEGRLGELRRLGLVYVIEFSPNFAAGSRTFADINRTLAAYRDVLDRIFANALRTTPRTGRPAEPLFSLDFLFRPLLEGRRVSADLSRFAVLRIFGVSFDDLDLLLREFRQNSYDFGYALRDRINIERQATKKTVRVLRASPDRPSNFSLTCHAPPEGQFTDKYGWEICEMGLPAAWKMTPKKGGTRFGEGVLVGHPDTGYSDHPAWGPIPPTRLLIPGDDPADNDSDARDHLVITMTNSEPGHGTSTGTQIMSASETDPTSPVDPNRVIGVATRASLIPIRVCNSTAFIFNFHVAQGLAWALLKKSHIASISVGGLFVPGFGTILKKAYKADMIVLCAAGNCVPFVVAPANYTHAFAVGASSENHTYWCHAPDGSKIALAAPGVAVRTTCISLDPVKKTVSYYYNFGSGTSFATAFAAGVCALWLAFFGRDYLIGLMRGRLQDVFTAIAKKTASVPPSWNTKRNGAGIINAANMLAFDPASLGKQFRRTRGQPDETVLPALSENIFQRSGAEADMLATAREWFHVGSDDEALARLDEFGIEMNNILVENGRKVLGRARVPLTEVSLSGFRAFFQDFGSLALKTALSPPPQRPSRRERT